MVQTKLKKTRGKRLLSAVRKYKKLMKRSARPRALRRLSEKIERLTRNLTKRVWRGQ